MFHVSGDKVCMILLEIPLKSKLRKLRKVENILSKEKFGKNLLSATLIHFKI